MSGLESKNCCPELLDRYCLCKREIDFRVRLRPEGAKTDLVPAVVRMQLENEGAKYER